MSSSPRIQGHVQSVMDPDGAVLLDLKRGKYFSLNGVAAEIWTALEAGRTRSEIAVELAAAYGVPEARVSGDVDAFMARLEQERLVDAAR